MKREIILTGVLLTAFLMLIMPTTSAINAQIDKKVIEKQNNIDKVNKDLGKNIENVTIGERIIALFMLGTCVFTWWFVYMFKILQRNEIAKTEEFMNEHTVKEYFSYVFIGAGFETSIQYLRYVCVLLFPKYVEEFDSTMDDLMNELFN
jgi:beta-lactamase regulating signal transducer with metallopeptidase domain